MSQTAADDWAARTEARVLDEAIRLAPHRPWSGGMAAAAAKAAGLSEADAALLLPKGPADLAALLFRRHDAQALAALSTRDPAPLKMRQRIQAAVLARVAAAMADEAAVKRAGAFLAQPRERASADALWRWAGDAATDENHYSKRAILSTVLASTMAVRLARGEAAAVAHLGARIDQVMAFEVWKARLPSAAGWAAGAAALLGRLRYG